MTTIDERSGPSIQVGLHGRLVHILDLRFDDIFIEDIAWGLSGINRFLGHTQTLVSVARHSILVAERVYVLTDGDPKHALAALLHDASESYIGDVPAPWKRLDIFRGYRELEDEVSDKIARRFGVSGFYPWTKTIEQADREALATEKRDVVRPSSLPWAKLPDPWPTPMHIMDFERRQDYVTFMYVFEKMTKESGLEWTR